MSLSPFGFAAFVLLSACATAAPSRPAPTASAAPDAPETSSAIAPAATTAASTAPSREGTLASENFDVVWDSTTATEDDAKRSLERAQMARAKFIEILGAYEASLAHELVHAIRLARWTQPARQTDPGLFWEEGFAELIAREAGFPSLGFPLYGVAPDVGAASFVARGEALPLPRLVTEHHALNFRCMAQAYVERISFMTYLRRRVGLALIVAVANVDAPLDVPTIETILRFKLEDLASWHDKDIARLAARPDTRAAATKFRETTPIRYLPVCPL